MTKLYNAFIMLRIVFMHVHFIRLWMIETLFYIYFDKINKYISYVK